ncbi:hypothetical protein BDR04DRAFT_1111694 [Suillus decipiens]|nr:hypothetical protein BDR04DRAFT_1111694 [Suillus decipiens]
MCAVLADSGTFTRRVQEENRQHGHERHIEIIDPPCDTLFSPSSGKLNFHGP